MKAYEDHNILKKAAYKQAKKDVAAEPKAKAAQPKIDVPEVPFELNITQIGASLQLRT